VKIGVEDLRDWAKISADWRAKELNTHQEVINGTRYHTTWFTAIHQNDDECRRYRVWYNEGLSPPYRKQQGWELFDATGIVCDREIRYSKRPDNGYLH